MRKIQTANHTIDTVFVLMLFCVFTVAVLLVLLAGANAYQSVAEKMEGQYSERTCLAYLDAKIHHYDQIDAVKVEPFGDGNALALYEELNGVRYKTLIYFADGYVRELFFEDGLHFMPEDGAQVVAAAGLDVKRKTNYLLQITCTSIEGRQEQLLVYLHGRKGADRYATTG